MTRRTYQQAQAWRAAAVALLAEVGVEVDTSDLSKAQKDRGSIAAGRATLVTYLTGSVSIGGPGPDADYLCEPLERHGLLNGWHPGSRGSGVVWVPQPERPAADPLSQAIHMSDLVPPRPATGTAPRADAAGTYAGNPRAVACHFGEVVIVEELPEGAYLMRLRSNPDNWFQVGKNCTDTTYGRFLLALCRELLTTDPGSGRVKP